MEILIIYIVAGFSMGCLATTASEIDEGIVSWAIMMVFWPIIGLICFFICWVNYWWPKIKK